MGFHNSTRVPVDDDYAALIGKAFYVFAYYEWTIIWIIEMICNGFVHQYARGESLTSGGVLKRLRSTIERSSLHKTTKIELFECADKFASLIVFRNALIHAHPCTNSDGAPIMAYQSNSLKSLPDMKWPDTELRLLISNFDDAAVEAGKILDKLRPGGG